MTIRRAARKPRRGTAADEGVWAALDHIAKFEGRECGQLGFPECLRPLAELREAVDRHLLLRVRDAIENGCTWAQVGEQLGISRQAAHERFAPQILALAEAATRDEVAS